MEQLKLTGLKSLPKDYKGEPCAITIEMIDTNGQVYESEIHLDNGFTQVAMRDALVFCFKNTDAVVAEVHIKSFRIKN